MAIKLTDILLTLALNFLHGAQSDHIRSCSGSSLGDCPSDQICNVTTHQCSCATNGLVVVGDECEAPTPFDPSSHSVTAAIVAVFTLVLVIAGLVLVIKKYNVIDIVCQKINMRRNNDVMYEDVMIGNDDPPLSP